MRHMHCLVGVILMSVLLVGCKQEAETKAPPAPEGTVAPTEQPKVPTDAEKASKSEQPPEAAPAVKQQAEAPQTTAPAAAEELAREAQTELDKLLQAVKDGKLADAEKLLVDLEARVNSLPAPLPDRVSAARKTFDAAKIAEGAKSVLPTDAPK